MAKRKSTKGQKTTIYKTIHRKLKIEIAYTYNQNIEKPNN
jgi:hypothetical protein